MSKLETNTTGSGRRVTVVFAGTLDISTTDQSLEVLAEATAEASELVIDLRQLDFVDSSGLAVIAQTAQQAIESGLTLRVIPSEQARRLFEITGIASHLDLEDHNA
jgi:anti-sigma B factor antagonist